MSSTRLLVIGDPHFKASNSSQTDALTRWVSDFLRGDGACIDAVVVLGDILHNHDRVDLHPLTRAIAFLSAIRRALGVDKQLWVIIGNHDRPNNACYLTREHPFTALEHWPNTVVADDAAVVVSAGGRKFALVPYVPVGMFKTAVQPLVDAGHFAPDGVTAVFAHQEFFGCKLGVTVSRAGDKYDPTWPMCISGHIHDFSSPQSNVVYPGTPFETSWTKKGTRGPVVFEWSEDGACKHTRYVVTAPIESETVTVPLEEFQDFLASVDASKRPKRVKVVCNSYDEFQAAKRTDAVTAGNVKLVPVVNPSAILPTEPRDRSREGLRPFSALLSERLNGANVETAEFIRAAFPFAA